MSVSVHPKIVGLDDLETGIHALKRSKLLVTPEFKDMLFAVERHHNDLKLAHLTGKAKDLVEQAERDTKFYNILIKMLCEIKEKRVAEQRQGLRKVYTWYKANKHVLFSGPHFGKEHVKQEAKEMLVKASSSTIHKPKVSRSTCTAGSTRPVSSQKNRAKSAPPVRGTKDHEKTAPRESSFNWRKDLEKGILKKDDRRVERLQLDQGDDEEAELKGLDIGDTTLNTATTANSDLLREAQMLSRVHCASPTNLTPLGEQSTNIEASSVRRHIVHPISSTVNPHATVALKLAQEKQEKILAMQKAIEKRSRENSLQAWQNFTQDLSYGQDAVDRLSFVGRSGTPNDVRYFSHGMAEMPEVYTQNIITNYANVMDAEGDADMKENGNKEQKENAFVHQTLEEFYETADALYPNQSKAPRPASRARIKSAPAVGRKASQQHPVTVMVPGGKRGAAEVLSRRPSTQPQKLGHQLTSSCQEAKGDYADEKTTTVKLDTVVKVIDSVSEEMTLFKERLAPEAQPGFRQPVATGIPITTTPHSHVRLPSPVARSNSPVRTEEAVEHVVETKPPRPKSSPLTSRMIQVGEEEMENSNATSPRQSRERCKSAGVVDWRGRVQPDSMRYKWGKTKFGGYTFVKKHIQRPVSLRSAGATSAGRRPKTAPVSIREKWKTDKPSQHNPRVQAQAASNSMTQIEQQDVDAMMNIQYLLGTSNSRADSLASLYGFDEEFLRSLRRGVHIPVTTDAPKEFVSFISPSPAAPHIAERRPHSKDRGNSAERPQSSAGHRGEGEELHHHLLPDFGDLHLPLDLEHGIHEDDDSLAGDLGDEHEELQLPSGGQEKEDEEVVAGSSHQQRGAEDEEPPSSSRGREDQGDLPLPGSGQGSQEVHVGQNGEDQKDAQIGQEHRSLEVSGSKQEGSKVCESRGNQEEIKVPISEPEVEDIEVSDIGRGKESIHILDSQPDQEGIEIQGQEDLQATPREDSQVAESEQKAEDQDPEKQFTEVAEEESSKAEWEQQQVNQNITEEREDAVAPDNLQPDNHLSALFDDLQLHTEPAGFIEDFEQLTDEQLSAFVKNFQTDDVVPSVTDALVVEEAGSITGVAFVAPTGQAPRPSSIRGTQPLKFSQVWQFDPSKYKGEDVKPRSRIFVGPSAAEWEIAALQSRKQVLSPRHTMASVEAATFPKVERSAGRIPGHSNHSTAVHMTQLSRRHAELMKRVPPPRTPPSIPLPLARTSLQPKWRGTPRGGPMLAELEHHARKEKSPRHFMQHVKDLRSSLDSAREITTAPSPSTESLMGTLQVCRLNMPLSRQRSLPTLFGDFGGSQDGLHSILKHPSELNLYAEHGLTSISEHQDTSELDRSVHFDYNGQAVPLTPLHRPLSPLQPPPPKPSTAPPQLYGGQRPESLAFLRQVTSSHHSSRNSSLHSSRNASLHSSQHSSRNNSEPPSPGVKNLARIGRPIAQMAHIPDPDEMAVAVQKQKEAAAAVDIQRLFRGYVARNMYKKLISEERMKMEDKRRAAVEIQRIYRGHRIRKENIERRPPNPEMLEWAHNYCINLVSRQQQRQIKMENRAEELSDNYHTANSKLSVIGPHVNIYEIYHPKKTGPTKKELNLAAICIQKFVRGWLVRRRFDKLHRKAAWYGSTFPKMVKEYKSMLLRVQRQHGAEQVQTPFSTKDMNDYIDTRKRYESVFDKKAFGGELEPGDIDSFFKECDLYPSQAEIEEAIRVATKGQSGNNKGQGLKRHEMLEVIFYIYTPRAAGLENTRRSTWMNPIIDGVEARRLLGSEFVEEAPLSVAMDLVLKVKREQREKERLAEVARKEAEAAAMKERLGLPHPKSNADDGDEEEDKKQRRPSRKVSITEPSRKNSGL